MAIDPNTPVLIGAGQSLDRVDAPDYRAASAADLAAQAARMAVDDAGGDGVLQRIGAIATTRTFEDSRPQPAPFGKSANFPRSVAARLGIDPPLAVWEPAGGNSPQDLVSGFAARIAAGEFEAVLLAGAEAISTVRHAQKQGIRLSFAEDPGGSVEDRGAGLEAFYDPLARRHGLNTPTLSYAVCENARRARRGMSRENYAQEMAQLFAPFAAIAQANPYAAWEAQAYSEADLATIGPQNRWIADPYPLRLVARDQVNQGAAVVLTSLRTARDLGASADRMVFLHGHARATEKGLLARADLGQSPAAQAACELALQEARIRVDDVAAFDFYSCYPIAVSNIAVDRLGLSPGDHRGLTLTGGLPYFGGPGNNYSMHAIAEAVAVARRRPGRAVLVGANGGYLSKYSVGVYSSEPRMWKGDESAALQARLNAASDVATRTAFEGEARVETYTVHHGRDGPAYAVAIARSAAGERIISRSAEADSDTAVEAHEADALGRSIRVTHADGVNLFTFAT